MKRSNLLLRLLRARPLSQRCAFLFILVLPVVLYYRYTQQKLRYGYTRVSNVEIDANEDTDLALRMADIKVYPEIKNSADTFSSLRLEDAPVPRLLRVIYNPLNTYVVHVDLKVDAARRLVVKAYIENDSVLRKNVHWLPSEMVTYKGVSMVLNTLAAMNLGLRMSKERDAPWHYFINLSGADYPLVSARNQQLLLGRPGVKLGRLNFMTLFPRKEWKPYDFRIRWMHWDARVAGASLKNGRLRAFRGMKNYPLEPYRHFLFSKAEAWMILSKPFVKFVVRSGYAKTMLLSHLYTRSTPEHYFADVLINHPIWKLTLVKDAFRRVVWYHNYRRSGQHPYLLDDKKYTGLEFWDDIRNSDALFARKFSRSYGPLMAAIDHRLNGFNDNATKMWKDNISEDSQKVSQRRFFNSVCTRFDQVTADTLRTEAEYTQKTETGNGNSNVNSDTIKPIMKTA